MLLSDRLHYFGIIIYFVISWMPKQGILRYDIYSLPGLFIVLLMVIYRGKKILAMLLIKEKWFIYFLILVLITTIVNTSNLLSLFSNIRWLILPFIYYLYARTLSPKMSKQFTNFVFVTFILQFLLSLLKLLVLNWDGESPIGFIGYSYSTLYVLFILGYVQMYRLKERKSLALILFILLLIVAISSGKRSLALLVPVFFSDPSVKYFKVLARTPKKKFCCTRIRFV